MHFAQATVLWSQAGSRAWRSLHQALRLWQASIINHRTRQPGSSGSILYLTGSEACYSVWRDAQHPIAARTQVTSSDHTDQF